MLQNVRHSGVIWWIGLESNGEDIIRVVPRNMDIVGAGLVVLELQRGQLELRNLLDALESEAMELLPRFGEA